MKYKVGDKVRVVKVNHALKKIYVGNEVIIKSINPNGNLYPHGTHYGVERSCFVFTEKELAPVDNHKIVITTDGNKTLARLYEGNYVIKSAVAKCSPEDEFVFETGAKLAFDRLMSEDKSKYYNGKVVCVETPYPNAFTVGKIYTVSDGVLRYDDGDIACVDKTSFEDIQKCFTSKFVELVE